jgi:hypothetical protein
LAKVDLEVAAPAQSGTAAGALLMDKNNQKECLELSGRISTPKAILKWVMSFIRSPERRAQSDLDIRRMSPEHWLGRMIASSINSFLMLFRRKREYEIILSRNLPFEYASEMLQLERSEL